MTKVTPDSQPIPPRDGPCTALVRFNSGEKLEYSVYAQNAFIPEGWAEQFVDDLRRLVDLQTVFDAMPDSDERMAGYDGLEVRIEQLVYRVTRASDVHYIPDIDDDGLRVSFKMRALAAYIGGEYTVMPE